MKKLLQISILLMLGIGLFSACSDDDKNLEELQLTVASVKTLESPLGGLKAASDKIRMQALADSSIPDFYSPYYVKYAGEKEWEYFNCPSIVGFTHEEGYEYVIRIKREKLEGISIPYNATLLEVISKVQKDSENIPLREGRFNIASKKSGDESLPYYVRYAGGEWLKCPNIEGFDYEEGYEYEISANRKYNGVNSPQKYSYIYVNTHHKEKKDSEGLPK